MSDKSINYLNPDYFVEVVDKLSAAGDAEGIALFVADYKRRRAAMDLTFYHQGSMIHDLEIEIYREFNEAIRPLFVEADWMRATNDAEYKRQVAIATATHSDEQRQDGYDAEGDPIYTSDLEQAIADIDRTGSQAERDVRQCVYAGVEYKYHLNFRDLRCKVVRRVNEEFQNLIRYNPNLPDGNLAELYRKMYFKAMWEASRYLTGSLYPG